MKCALRNVEAFLSALPTLNNSNVDEAKTGSKATCKILAYINAISIRMTNYYD